jgi:hypothetical protein
MSTPDKLKAVLAEYSSNVEKEERTRVKLYFSEHGAIQRILDVSAIDIASGRVGSMKEWFRGLKGYSINTFNKDITIWEDRHRNPDLYNRLMAGDIGISAAHTKAASFKSSVKEAMKAATSKWLEQNPGKHDTEEGVRAGLDAIRNHVKSFEGVDLNDKEDDMVIGWLRGGEVTNGRGRPNAEKRPLTDEEMADPVALRACLDDIGAIVSKNLGIKRLKAVDFMEDKTFSKLNGFRAIMQRKGTEMKRMQGEVKIWKERASKLRAALKRAEVQCDDVSDWDEDEEEED